MMLNDSSPFSVSINFITSFLFFFVVNPQKGQSLLKEAVKCL